MTILNGTRNDLSQYDQSFLKKKISKMIRLFATKKYAYQVVQIISMVESKHNKEHEVSFTCSSAKVKQGFIFISLSTHHLY